MRTIQDLESFRTNKVEIAVHYASIEIGGGSVCERVLTDVIVKCNNTTHLTSLKNLTKLLESIERATSTANLTSGESRTESEYWVTKLCVVWVWVCARVCVGCVCVCVSTAAMLHNC